MRKNSIGLVSGSAVILWLLAKFFEWAYKRNPQLFKFILEDILIPQAKQLIVDLMTSAVYRAMYGDPARGKIGFVDYGRNGRSYIPYNQPVTDRRRQHVHHMPYTRPTTERN